jgi:hypothetical protein
MFKYFLLVFDRFIVTMTAGTLLWSGIIRLQVYEYNYLILCVTGDA